MVTWFGPVERGVFLIMLEHLHVQLVPFSAMTAWQMGRFCREQLSETRQVSSDNGSCQLGSLTGHVARVLGDRWHWRPGGEAKQLQTRRAGPVGQRSVRSDTNQLCDV